MAGASLAQPAEPDETKAEDQGPPQAAEALVPPRVLTRPEVSYPDGATGEATVLLEVVVGPDGVVQSVAVVEGAEPFASRAVDALRGARFEPATRGGKAATAKIRFAVRFLPPETVEEAKKQEPAGPETPKETGAVEEAPYQVTVTGERPAPGTASLGKAEIRQMPGAFGDPFRAIEALPGVTPIVSGLPFFYVRGAPPGNVGYYLDGVRVPYLYHIGLGPSVVHPAMVERVDLYRGGYPARYGRFAGAIVAGETTAPRNELHGEGNVRLFDAGAMVEGGFADGRGTALVGGRYSYTAALLSIFVPEVRLDYRDYQARVSYDITPNDRLTLFSFGAFDLLQDIRRGVTTTLFGSEFYRADLRYDHFFGDDSQLRLAATLGLDRTKITETQNVEDRIVGGRAELTHPFGGRLLLRSGLDVMADTYSVEEPPYVDPDDPDPQQIARIFPPRTDTATGAHVDLVIDATPQVEVTPGVRADVYTQGSTSAVGIDPRISARFKITDNFRILHAYGIAHQPPSFVIPIPGVSPATLDQGLQRSFQTSAGVEVDLPLKFTVTATVFNNVYLDMTDALGTSSGDFESLNDELERRSLGSGRGLELHLRRPFTERLGGYLSYTLSRSTRSIGNEEFLATFDRTHVADGAVSYDLGRRWRAGTRAIVYSGIPTLTPSTGFIVGPRRGSAGRSPPFYRVDLRLEKQWIVFQKGWISLVFEVMNVTLSTETFEVDTGQNQTIGPITIPSIGVEGGF